MSIITPGGSAATALISSTSGLDHDIYESYKYPGCDLDDDFGSQCMWPAARMAGQMFGNTASLISIVTGHYYENEMGWSGNPGYRYITGVTRNASGQAIGGVTVILFNTATNQPYMTTTSDPFGNYTVYHPDTQNCYVISYFAGSANSLPEIAGTANTLVGV